jgi:hypothetical protein
MGDEIPATDYSKYGADDTDYIDIADLCVVLDSNVISGGIRHDISTLNAFDDIKVRSRWRPPCTQ